MPKQDKKLARDPRDNGSNYNAFGYDPDGRIAYLVALFYGPDWRPRTIPKQFGGPPAPPRFGPPAPYQKHCLPRGFKPRMHRDYYKIAAAFAANEEAKIAGEETDYLNHPDEFDPGIFDAFKFGREFMERELEDEETSIEGDDNDVDGGLMELKCQEGDTTLNWELGEVKEVNGTAEKLEFGRE